MRPISEIDNDTRYQELTAKYEELSAKMDRLLEKFCSSPQPVQSVDSSGPGALSQVMSTCNCNCHSSVSGLPFGAPPSYAFQRTNTADMARSYPEIAGLVYQIDTARASSVMQEKSLHAVVENLPEPPDADKKVKQKHDSDRTLMQKICESAGIEQPEDVWRHPSRSDTRSRPIKVKFKSTDARNDFIRLFRRNLSVHYNPSLQGGRLPSCRRDMSPPELQLLYILRKIAYNQNAAAGKNAWYVRDLILTETDPKFIRSFTPRSN